MAIVNYKNVDIHIDSKIILENVSFELQEGEFAYIVGAVGSGKSTLLKTIYGEVDIMDGQATVFDEYDLRNLRSNRLQALRKRIGIVFQDFQLLTDRNVNDNLDFVLRSTGWTNKQEREKRIREVQSQLGNGIATDAMGNQTISNYRRMIEEAKRELRSMGYNIY